MEAVSAEFEIELDGETVYVVATGNLMPAEPSVGYMMPYAELEGVDITDGDGKAVTVSVYDQRRIEDKANEHLQRRAA